MGRTSDAKERLLSTAMNLVWAQSYGSVTIDQLCEAAGVKKGSFYYFFPSKAELVVAALEQNACEHRPRMDDVFSSSRAPLERLEKYFEMLVAKQYEMREKYGQIVGCPLATVGCEVSSQEPAVCLKIQSLLGNYYRYLESMIRDGQAEGTFGPGDPATKARTLFAFIEGVLTQARIQNDMSVIDNLMETSLPLLGVKPVLAAS